MTSPITTHVLDLARGRPAAGIAITLSLRDASGGYTEVARGTTDDDGRLRTLLGEGALQAGATYRLSFDTGSYFREQMRESFYPEVVVTFAVRDEPHYHVPLLLSPFGYSTYRGS